MLFDHIMLQVPQVSLTGGTQVQGAGIDKYEALCATIVHKRCKVPSTFVFIFCMFID